jgi:hypothetical protein
MKNNRINFWAIKKRALAARQDDPHSKNVNMTFLKRSPNMFDFSINN